MTEPVLLRLPGQVVALGQRSLRRALCFHHDILIAEKDRAGRASGLTYSAAQFRQVLVGIHHIAFDGLPGGTIVSAVVECNPQPLELRQAAALGQGHLAFHGAENLELAYVPCRYPPRNLSADSDPYENETQSRNSRAPILPPSSGNCWKHAPPDALARLKTMRYKRIFEKPAVRPEEPATCRNRFWPLDRAARFLPRSPWPRLQ